MRRFALFTLPATLGLALGLASPALAQHWNDSGPGRDLLGSTVTDFDSFRERTPAAPAFTPGVSAPQSQQARGPIPLLDWVPPPPVPAAAPPRRSSTPRRTVRRTPAAQPARDAAPLPASTRAAPTPAGNDWERSLAERERELERLRRILEDDRLRYQQVRQPQIR